MKGVIIFLLGVFCVAFFNTSILLAKTADSKSIEMRAREMDESRRSVLPVRAWLEGTDVYVTFLNSPQEVFITVFDSAGTVVEENVCQSPQTIQMHILEGKGNYRIEISYSEVYLSGEFSLD